MIKRIFIDVIECDNCPKQFWPGCQVSADTLRKLASITGWDITAHAHQLCPGCSTTFAGRSDDKRIEEAHP